MKNKSAQNFFSTWLFYFLFHSLFFWGLIICHWNFMHKLNRHKLTCTVFRCFSVMRHRFGVFKWLLQLRTL